MAFSLSATKSDIKSKDIINFALNLSWFNLSETIFDAVNLKKILFNEKYPQTLKSKLNEIIIRRWNGKFQGIKKIK